jgi:hypothetical protein
VVFPKMVIGLYLAPSGVTPHQPGLQYSSYNDYN